MIRRLACALVLCACGSAPAAIDAGRDAPAPVDAGPPFPPVAALPSIDAANAVGPSDPLFEGQQRFLWDAFGTERVSDLPPADFLIGLMQSEPDVFGDQLAGFGFVADPGDDLPVGLKRGLEDPSALHTTCALCHVARLPDGRLWIGAPNGELELGRFLIELDHRWVAAGNAAFLTALEESKLAALGPGRTNAESDDYPDVVPVDFPPYFGLGQRMALNYLGTGANVRTEAYLSVFTNGAGNPDDATAVVPFPPSARIDPMIAFMGSLEPPPAPPQDAALVASGSAIFARERCGSCHGTPAELGIVQYDDTAAERIPGDDAAFPRGSIATDRAHRVLVDGDGGTGGDQGRADLLRFIIRKRLEVALSDGYRALDLRALWLTAPYLHDGSVPTLEDLLRPSAQRPATFPRGTFTIAATLPGNGNAGHEFGTAITDGERTALAAYLRSL